MDNMNFGLIIFGLSVSGLVLVAIGARLYSFFCIANFLAEKNQPAFRAVRISKEQNLAFERERLLAKELFDRRTQRIRLVAALTISAAVLLAALFVLLSGRSAVESQKWAVGAVGTIIGYWLKQ
jgi:hypothetical protein